MTPSYGLKGGAYDVRPGQVWSVGFHLVACGDLEAGDGERFLRWARLTSGRAPALFYFDPPWNLAFITRFRKGAGVPQKPAHTVRSIVQRVLRLGQRPLVPVFFEMGVTYEPAEVQGWINDAGSGALGMYGAGHWPITYAKGTKPAWLWGCHVTQRTTAALRGADDAQTPGLVLAACTRPGDIVVDLCLGLGCTARAAQQLERVCWGLELHPRRCSATLVDLARACKQSPSLVSVLED